MVNSKNLHTIGETAKICKVSRKTLIFYEELGILKPDYICPSNGYRYYSDSTIQLMPILKYYKQMGFKLQDMNGVGDNGSCLFHERNFLNQISFLEDEEKRIQNSRQALMDWLELIHEGMNVTNNKFESINIKYIQPAQYFFLNQDFDYDYKESVINVPWIRYLEENNAEITGPVILAFDDCQKKSMELANRVTIMQKPVRNNDSNLPLENIGGKTFISSYYIGNHAQMYKKYADMESWAKENGYSCGPNVYERFVVDYWTTTDVNMFVTEILIPIVKN